MVVHLAYRDGWILDPIRAIEEVGGMRRYLNTARDVRDRIHHEQGLHAPSGASDVNKSDVIAVSSRL